MFLFLFVLSFPLAHSLPAPHVPDPYLTLATIYEDLGDSKKLLQMLMIVAHLKRKDVDLWTKSANLAIEQQNFPIAVQCLSKGIELSLCITSIQLSEWQS